MIDFAFKFNCWDFTNLWNQEFNVNCEKPVSLYVSVPVIKHNYTPFILPTLEYTFSFKPFLFIRYQQTDYWLYFRHPSLIFWDKKDSFCLSLVIQKYV